MAPSSPHPTFAALTKDEPAQNAALFCPLCGESTGLHIDTVQVLSAGGQRLVAHATGEDNNARIEVSLADGAFEAGRRHRIVLTSWCEHCGQGADISFEQHKGATLFKTTDIGPSSGAVA